MRFLTPRHALGALLTLALFFCVSMAYAGTATLTCTLPTTYATGAPIPAGTPITIKFYRGSTAAAASTATTPVGTASSCSYTDTTAPDGQTSFYTATATVAGIESARTAAVSIAIPNPTPNPPSGLTVVAVVAGLNMAPAYRINADGTRGTAVVGFVPTGTACAGSPAYSYRGVTYARVPRETVKWWSTSPTANVAAPCRTG